MTLYLLQVKWFSIWYAIMLYVLLLSTQYRKAYYSVMAENEDLKAQLEELKKRVASLERRSTYKRH